MSCDWLSGELPVPGDPDRGLPPLGGAQSHVPPGGHTCPTGTRGSEIVSLVANWGILIVKINISVFKSTFSSDRNHQSTKYCTAVLVVEPFILFYFSQTTFYFYSLHKYSHFYVDRYTHL